MCVKPNIINGFEVSCRECGQCFATYKNTWVARCVAQKQVYPYSYAITLTYADVDSVPPLGARVFRYKDVADFWKRLRQAAKRKWKQTLDFSYVIVGEKGTRKGRCHYHGVLFSDQPLHELGQFSGPNGTAFALKRRLNWDVWGHGFVEFQEADRDGMAYVLKYILKGKMNAQRSRGQNHEGKTEWLTSSYLWCSKIPPIGAKWLWRKMKELNAVGLCPPSLRITVPSGGDWYVSGEVQKELCLYLREANQRYNQQQGRDLAGWKTLVNSVADEIEKKDTGEIIRRKPWEWLNYGEEEEQESGEAERAVRAFERFEQEHEREQAIAVKIRRARETVAKCGNVKPCKLCANGLSGSARAASEQEYKFRFESWKDLYPQGDRESDREYAARFRRWWRTRLKVARFCVLAGTAGHKEDFEGLIPLEKARPKTRHKKAIGKAL